MQWCMHMRTALMVIVLVIQSISLSQPQRVIVLDNADSLFGRVIDGAEARELIGNVRFHQENVFVTCNRAVQYIQAGDVVLLGNVVVVDSNVTMRSPRGIYHRNDRYAEAFDSVSLDDGNVRLVARYGNYLIGPKRAFFRSHVVVHDSASIVTADSLTYFRFEKRSIAAGNVIVRSATDNITLTGQRLEHFSTNQFSRMTEHPVMVQFDTSAGGSIDTLVVRGKVMEAYRDTVKRLVAIDSVQIVRTDLAGLAGEVDFYTLGDSILLRRSPVVWYENTQVSGDSINAYLKDRKINRLIVTGNAFAVSQSDSLYPERLDQLAGDIMSVHFEEKGLDRINVYNRALSVYHLYEDSAANGLNTSSGDRILISFHKGKVRSINVTGGVEGRYVPENLVKNREREYALPGFVWRTDRPRMRRGDFPDRSVVSNWP